MEISPWPFKEAVSQPSATLPAPTATAGTDTHLNMVCKTPPIFPISPFGTYMQLASEAGEGRYKSWRQRGKMAHTLPRYTYTRYAGCTGSIHRIYCKICREASTSSIPFAEDFRLRLKAFFSMHFCLKGRRAFESPAPDLQRSQRVSCSWSLSQETPRSPS